MIDFDGSIEEFTATVTGPHRINRTATLLDLNHDFVEDLTPRLRDGQINFDLDADITRSAPMSLIDPSRQIDLDGESSDSGTLHMRYMISVEKTHTNLTTGQEFVVPLITGPINKFERNEGIIAVEVQGKELLAKRAIWRSLSFKEGQSRNAVLRAIMTAAGETVSMMRIPKGGGGKLSKDVTYGSDTTYWDAAKDIAKDMDCQLFYDGRGILQLRPWDKRPTVAVISSGVILEEPVFGYSVENLVNAIDYTGGKTKGSNVVPKARAWAPPGHPLSPRKFRRNGVDMYYPRFIKNDKAKTQADVNRKALAALNSALLEALEVSTVIADLSVLEPGDECVLDHEDAYVTFRLKKGSIGFSNEGEMTIGFHRKIALAKKVGMSNVRRTTKTPRRSTRDGRRSRRRGGRRRNRRRGR